MLELKKILDEVVVSSLYKTDALYFEEQDAFLNLVIGGHTKLSPQQLLNQINMIEAAFGRNRSKEIRNGPRTLDIDILLYNDSIINTKTLSLPHPRITERAFVLVPLLEIAPNLVNPATGQFFSEYLQAVQDQGIYLYDSLNI